MQLDLFDKPQLVSRWKNDGPFPWTDSGCGCPRSGDRNVKYFDGIGWCQSEIRWCDRCGVWHPLSFVWGEGSASRYIADYRHTVPESLPAVPA